MRLVLLMAAALIAGASAAADEKNSLAVGPGSYIYWTSAYDGGSEQYQEKMIAEGDGFAVYQSVNDYQSSDASDYFALFSGTYFTTCDAEMPTEEERKALAALLPFTAGQSVEITSGDGARVEIGAATEFFLMGKTWPAHKVAYAYADGDGTTDEDVIVLDQVPVTVSIRWDESSVDAVTLVTRPKSEFEPDLSEDTIGNCASLFNQQIQ